MRRKYKIFHLVILILLVAGAPVFSQGIAATQQLALIPYPKSVERGVGKFIIHPYTSIVADSLFKNEVNQLNLLLRAGLGKALKFSNPGASGTILLKMDQSIQAEEGYRLEVSVSKVVILAKTPIGMFRAVETLRQLLPVNGESKIVLKQLALPVVKIEDEPAYAWRGMHLDVARHFFSIDYLKRFIDRLALYKFNKFHLHLTDDQGWRIEIKKYPKLTELGAWRTFNNHDTVCMERAKENPDFIIDPAHIIHKNGKKLYGGFYTQKELKDLVAYAAARHIDIIPEVDMPGHMMAAINAYPFLTCNGKSNWGELFSTPICPCNEATYTFAENVYKEIMDIFPSKYLHIGGDEVDRSDWAKSESCKSLMAREGIKDLPALQSYFIHRMERFFNKNGRKLIGWDEILEGGISPTAIIMYWRGWKPEAPALAAKNGNKVIMTPGNPLYFDNQPDQNSLSDVYHYHPISKELTPEEARSIIGAQANTWTEYIPSEKRADYMIMPRMTALAEALWTSNPTYYRDYLIRLQSQYIRWDVLKINYRLPDLPGLIEENVFVNQDTLFVKAPLPGINIHYSTDGTLPQRTSKVLSEPLLIKNPQTIKLAAFLKKGTRGDIYSLNYKQQSLAIPVAKDNLKPGLEGMIYKGSFKSALNLPARADSVFVTGEIVVPASVTAPAFGLKYKGYIDVPVDGVYSFFLTCDDGGILEIADRMVVDNDGLHAPREKSGQVALQKGLQHFMLNFIEGGGGFTLKLNYSINGSTLQEVPSSWFKH
jgi:hexosaminidase